MASQERASRYLPPSAFVAKTIRDCEALVARVEVRDPGPLQAEVDEVLAELQSVIDDTAEDDVAMREIVASLLQTRFLEAIVSNAWHQPAGAGHQTHHAAVWQKHWPR
jgi:hypothetical protein